MTFALQRKVLDELEVDMKRLVMNRTLREAVEKLNKSMRQNMQDGLDALKKNNPDAFFDALFEVSEDIISLSSLVRDPKLEDEVFLTLVKAISRLGRNNANFIQDFTETCSFIQRGTRPRVTGSA